MKPENSVSKQVFADWVEQAKIAASKGQSLTGFVLNAHPDNRAVARRAFLVVRKGQGWIYGS